MSDVIEYRTMSESAHNWSDWLPYHGGCIHSCCEMDIQIRTVRLYTLGMTLKVGDVTYKILDSAIRIERIAGEGKEYLACEVTYGNGDNSFDFVSREALDRYTVVGE